MRFTMSNIFVLLATISLTFLACNRNGEKSDAPLQEGVEQVGEAAADALRSDKEELRADINETRKALDKNKDILENKLDKATEKDERASLAERINKINIYDQKLGDKLATLNKTDSLENWDAFEKETRRYLKEAREPLVDIE